MDSNRPSIKTVTARAYCVPTDKPEADGTFAWTSTTLIVAQAQAGGRTGIGYTYTHRSAAELINSNLAEAARGMDAFDPPGAWLAMQQAVRNIGRDGLAATAISAVDTALWDLKSRLLDLPLCLLLGRLRNRVPIYGSGGFTTYSDAELREQLAGWVERDGCRWVKMKIGSRPDDDPHRVKVAKAGIGGHTLFVDANGAYSTRQALQLANRFADQGVAWFEEPVSSDDLEGLRAIRHRAPPGMDIAAGEYGYDLDYFRRMLEAGAISVLQADITRCGGVTGFLQVAALCEAHHVDLSAHCAPSLHLHPACAAPRLRHLEWFHDHVRIEQMLFDGAPIPHAGAVAPDLARPGFGLSFKAEDAERFSV